MPYKGDGHQFSIRIPKETWQAIEALFAARQQSHLSKNDKVLTLLKESLEIISKTKYVTEKQDLEDPEEVKKETGG